ncbi:RNA 3'-terminal phosphate cyclase [Novosphingobium mangrovi (ex Huang et al. 2023)]|uniref:RNA 3'-terminal phosphate cyclase n=1 Tax=Novosphingobium mangrovi (ex Huang et al. 2023) TaxID=2976432 RepID=A0ABT2I1J5_9SPHN|nr:RNA 3'-terminal phosphate cyclase [Novosphingobium mangrovi (ex Huang et al. 2023)]MCT2398671.1 RNA 3'-terminal phosphate cyclase [Novosphingobium mangrovi (ex Huang et al. 2023)]
MIIIDGSEGEGGGQIVRNSCALSLVTGEPFRITHVRGKRSKPGLMRQHVTAVEAACVISGAEVRGLAVGSSELEFRPGKAEPGEYHFAVGTAGSTGLVLQTVLMPLILAGGPSRLVLEGGTHNMLAPPFDFIEKSFLPVIERMGPKVRARIVRHGFYPRGGGRIEIDIEPAPLAAIECIERGVAQGVAGQAMFAGVPFDIADRMVKRAAKDLPDWPENALCIRELPAEQGPGVILMLEARYAHVTEVVSGFGQLSVPAERLAKTSAARMKGYAEAQAFAGPYLADQLILPFVLAGGGAFTTVKPSQHTLTAIDIAQRFTGRRITLARQPAGEHLLTVG